MSFDNLNLPTSPTFNFPLYSFYLIRYFYYGYSPLATLITLSAAIVWLQCDQTPVKVVTDRWASAKLQALDLICSQIPKQISGNYVVSQNGRYVSLITWTWQASQRPAATLLNFWIGRKWRHYSKHCACRSGFRYSLARIVCKIPLKVKYENSKQFKIKRHNCSINTFNSGCGR